MSDEEGALNSLCVCRALHLLQFEFRLGIPKPKPKLRTDEPMALDFYL
jgi:hypothetical protein